MCSVTAVVRLDTHFLSIDLNIFRNEPLSSGSLTVLVAAELLGAPGVLADDLVGVVH